MVQQKQNQSKTTTSNSTNNKIENSVTNSSRLETTNKPVVTEDDSESFLRKRKINIIEEEDSTSNDMNNNSTLSSMMHTIEEESSQLDTTTTTSSANNTNKASTPNKRNYAQQTTTNNNNVTTTTILASSAGSADSDKFKTTVEFVGDYLEKVMSQSSPLGDPEQNKLTSNVLQLARSLIFFGFYSFRDLLKLSRIMLEILDKDHSAAAAAAQLLSNDDSELIHDINTSRRSCVVAPASSSPSSMMSSLQANLLFDIKLDIIEIFEFILNVRLDYRLTYLLSEFKNYCDSNDPSESDTDCSEVVKRLLNESDRLFIEYPCETLDGEHESNKNNNNKNYDENDSSNNKSIRYDILDFDGNGGKKFLKNLLKLIEQDHPKLTTGALNLIFRRFSQIQETVNSLKQVSRLQDNDKYIKSL